ncbi:hypothetical protein PAL_GLEAN10022501 [Pteropus alecto]|uniref:Uncharacterized protein n=1 Tax=Pteropus alecto TaxID=9402 RepID=L5JU78_PTEAL|nr:hypothetical protein PAL_GLEAN10022501 [Pteropus alecto]
MQHQGLLFLALLTLLSFISVVAEKKDKEGCPASEGDHVSGQAYITKTKAKAKAKKGKGKNSQPNLDAEELLTHTHLPWAQDITHHAVVCSVSFINHALLLPFHFPQLVPKVEKDEEFWAA